MEKTQVEVKEEKKTTLTQEEEDRLRALLARQWRVFLHNDDHNGMLYVVQILLRFIEGMSQNHATKVMVIAHRKGSAEVVVCPKEKAEYYQLCLRSSGLTATIEEVE